VLLSAGVWLAYGRASSSVAASVTSASTPARATATAQPVAASAASASAQPAAGAGPATATATAVAGAAYSQPDALRALAALWELKLPEGEPCALAAKLNLRCLSAKGGLEELRQLDRPAVLTLHDDPVRPNYLLLTALDDDYATLQGADGKPQRIKLAALEARYSGEFSTYWRAPRSWRDEVSAGDKGPDVDWLARRLAQIYGLKKPAEGQPLNAALRARLTEFQNEQKLKADGVAGPKTFIRLYQQGGVREPRLLAAEGNRCPTYWKR
jgi:general secretion pathway protein A